VILKHEVYPDMGFPQLNKHQPKRNFQGIIKEYSTTKNQIGNMEEEFKELTLGSLEVFQYQAAGHITAGKLLLYKKNFALKPQLKKELFDREVAFYKAIQKYTLPGHDITMFLPRYHGVRYIASDSIKRIENSALQSAIQDALEKSMSNMAKVCGAFPTERRQHYMILDNVTLGMSHPTSIDIKIGRQTFEPSASLEKKEREVRKYPFQESIGFRICGFQRYDVCSKEYLVAGKEFGRQLKPETVHLGLASCFYDGFCFREDVIVVVIEKLRKVLGWVACQDLFAFFCSSILINFDNLPMENFREGEGPASYLHEDSSPEDKTQPLSAPESESGLPRALAAAQSVQVNMIDFAHVLPKHSSEECEEEGYLYGLQQLINHLEDMLMTLRGGQREVYCEYVARFRYHT
jgi:hypothetical protein